MTQLPLLTVAPSHAPPPGTSAPLVAPLPENRAASFQDKSRAASTPQRGTPAAPPAYPKPDTPPALHGRPALLAWLIDDVLIPCYRALIPKLNVWQWADAKNVFLDSKASPTPGYYSSQKTPWVRRLLETFTDPHFAQRKREYHQMKSSRTGFTEAQLCILRYMPRNLPGSALYAINTVEEGKKVIEFRLVPTLPAEAKTADADDITKKNIKLRNMTIEVGGSYSPALFLNKWLKFIALDELDSVDIADDGETIQNQARTRMVGVPGAFLACISKPRKWKSPHHVEVVTGTLDAFLVPCPHCGTFQELSDDGKSPTHELRIDEPLRHGEANVSPPLGHWDPLRTAYVLPAPPLCGRLRFDHCRDLTGQWDFARFQRETYYECVCGCKIDEHELLTAENTLHTPRAEFFSEEVRALIAQRPVTAKQAMVLSGRHLQTNPRPDPDKRSGHISDLYSLHEDMTWGHYAALLIKALRDITTLRTFHNNHRGLPWRERRAEIGDAELAHCREAYKRGTVPFVPTIATTCADSQDDCWKFITTAYRVEWKEGTAVVLGWERAIIRWGRAGTRADLIEQATDPFHLATDETTSYRAHTGFVDLGGHRHEEVLDLCYESHSANQGATPFFFPVLGKGGMHIRGKGHIWFTEHGVHKGHRYRTFSCDDDAFKRTLYLGSIAQAAKIKEALAKGFAPTTQQLPPRLWIPGIPGDKALRELFDELQSERLDAEGTWKKIRSAENDFGDALKYCDAWFEFMLPFLRRVRAEELATAAAAPKPAA